MTGHTDAIWRTSEALPTSQLLGLPAELRQRIFEYVFTTDSVFPPQKDVNPARLLGLIGYQHQLYGPGSTKLGLISDSVKAMLLCRRLYQETRLMPLQVNPVQPLPVMGSNTTATKRFLDKCKAGQRRAIRKMELHLLASVTEAWSLQSILRSVADVHDPAEELEDVPRGAGNSEFDTSCTEINVRQSDLHGSSNLRQLAITVTTRDLLLAQADSLVGLLHVLTVPPACEASTRPSTPFACTASWVSEIAHFKSLRRLTLVIEASAVVANQVPIDDRKRFADFVQVVVPTTKVDIQWKVQENMILAPDDSESWDFLGRSDVMASDAG
ncbi:hypothetical protein H2200_010497 [Cladophialophora chaetospira]|uniref:Uncharacterized protein n=1 Tax=Cladophialophora chaetospira TaxID=386627 RepID=A0AA39CED4_9EURO|nr:hypothetical protein H2200_010497 [Cladophialophora chaetospira]